MTARSKRILIVDDDATVLRLLNGLLGGEYELAKATSGEQALTMLPSFLPALVMLDIAMPDIDGHEICRRIRSSPFGHGIQMMMVSARSSREEQARAHEAGADDYVVKPFDPQELCSRIRLHFRLRGALDTVTSTTKQLEELRPQGKTQLHDVTVAALTKVAEFRDTETGEHLVRMRSYAQIIAEELGRHGPPREFSSHGGSSRAIPSRAVRWRRVSGRSGRYGDSPAGTDRRPGRCVRCQFLPP